MEGIREEGGDPAYEIMLIALASLGSNTGRHWNKCGRSAVGKLLLVFQNEGL